VALESLPDYEAVQLFLERAQTALPGFAMTQENASAIAQVCQHLDGIPLALELAAARVKLLRVEEIAVRLDDRFHLLTSGSRTALPRHQTLQAMIDWSHDLLPEPERVLLRRLSVFAGGWTFEAAESICIDLSPDPSPERKGESAAPPSLVGKVAKHAGGEAGGLGPTVLDLLTSLVNKSLLLAERKQGQETRYRMLETIRQYANEKLWVAGEGELVRQRHLAYFVDLAERAEPNLRAFDMVMWLDRLETELDNIRVALEYALESDIEPQLRLASALLWFWHIRGHKNEGVDWLERGLSIEAADRGDQPLMPTRAMIQGKALNASGFLMTMFFDIKKAQTRFEESLALFQELGSTGQRGAAYALWGLASAIPSADNRRRNLVEQSLTLFREVGDKFGAAECLMQLSGLAQDDNNYQQAIIYAEEQLALRKEIGDQDGIATALLYLGNSVFLQSDHQRAIAMLEESLAIFRELGNKWAIGITLSTYGDIWLWQGSYERAIKIYAEALAFAQDLGDRFLVALNTCNLGVIAWFQGDYAQAIQKITDGLAAFRDMGDDSLTASCLHALGDIAVARGDDKNAAQWYEAELAFGRGIEFNMSIAFAFCGLGKLAWVQGNYELATRKFEEGLEVGREAGLKTAIFHALYGLGRVNQSQGNDSAARGYYVEMLGMQQQRPPPWALKTYGCAIAYPVEALAVLAAAQNQFERSTRLFGVAEMLYPQLRFEMSAKERAQHDQAVAAARAALGEEAFAKFWSEGQGMTLEEAVAYALES
jgi:tetratricopeptide (TPR) repeat protein